MPMEDERWFKTWLSWRTRPRHQADPEAPAQDIYKAMIKDTISPALRDLGFKGSGGRYSIDSDESWSLLGFQKSAYSDAAQIQFTINLAVVHRSAWNELRAEFPYFPEKPTAQLGTGRVGHTQRIAFLKPGVTTDEWYSLVADSDPADIVEQVLHDVREYGLPWLQLKMVDPG